MYIVIKFCTLSSVSNLLTLFVTIVKWLVQQYFNYIVPLTLTSCRVLTLLSTGCLYIPNLSHHIGSRWLIESTSIVRCLLRINLLNCYRDRNKVEILTKCELNLKTASEKYTYKKKIVSKILRSSPSVTFRLFAFMFLCPRFELSGAYCFCPVCLSVVNFNLCYNFWTVRDIWHAYSTNDALSIDTKLIDLVTLTLTLKLKIAFWTLLPPGV